MELNLQPLLTSLVASGVSQKYLADKLNCDPKTIKNIITRDNYINEAEAIKRLGISHSTFRGLIKDGVIPKYDTLNGEKVWKESEVRL